MRLLATLFISLYLTACSLGSTAYQHLDYLALWYAADYVHLTKAQKKQLSQATQDFVKWHRVSEIPKYQTLLTDFQTSIREQSLTPSKADQFRETIRLFLANIRHYLDSHLPALLSTLDDKQYQEILANLQKEVAEQQAKRDKSSQEKRLKQLQEETEDWYGPLLTEQIDILKQIRVKQDQQAPYWRAETQAWLAELEALTQLPAKARTQAMQKLLLQTLTPSSNRENSTRALWFKIWSLATPTQRDQILEKLSEYHEILLDIQQET